MNTAQFHGLDKEALLVKTWPCARGTVGLYLCPGQKAEALVRDIDNKVSHISQLWISGLPAAFLEGSIEAQRRCLSQTCIRLSPVQPGGYRLYIDPRLNGGMFKMASSNLSVPLDIDQLLRHPVAFQPQPLEVGSDGRFKILSLDGGGTRGIIPLKILSYLETLIGPAHETFDLIGGTSTGGMIALGLAKAIPATAILDIYLNRSDELFVKNSHPWIHNAVATVAGAVGPGRETLLKALFNSPVYSDVGIRSITNELFGQSVMKDALTNLLVTAVDITLPHSPRTYFFHNLDRPSAFYAMQDVARATSSAPTYLPHVQLGGFKYVDGGLTCNNPALECYLHASANGIQAESQYCLSLGTGFSDVEGIGDDNHNLLYWARSIFPTVSSAASNTVDERLAGILSDRYWRITPYLEHEIPLDAHTSEKLQLLEDLGQQLVEERQDNLRGIARTLRPDLS